MPESENRSAAYVLVREHRKRRSLVFAGRHRPKIDAPAEKTKGARLDAFIY